MKCAGNGTSGRLGSPGAGAKVDGRGGSALGPGAGTDAVGTDLGVDERLGTVFGSGFWVVGVGFCAASRFGGMGREEVVSFLTGSAPVDVFTSLTSPSSSSAFVLVRVVGL